MANKLENVKLVDVALLKGKYTTDLKAYIEAKAGGAAAAAIKTVAVDSTNNKLKFYKEISTDVTESTTPAFSVDYAKVAGTGAAADVSVATIDGLTATTVQGAIAELVEAIGDIDYSSKADKVEGATAGNFAGLDADGNLTDSGKKAADFDVAGAAAAVSGYAEGETAKTVKEVADSLGTAAAEDVATTEIADESEDDSLVSAKQVAKYVKDKTASVVGALHFRGIKTSTEEVTDPKEGDVVIVGTTEYIYDGSKWQELGDEGNYVPKTRTIAGIDLVDDLTKEELQTALEINPNGEENVIETVQVNGVALTPDEDKAVNVTIAEGTDNGTIAVNGTDVSIKGLDTMAYETATDYVKFDDITLATEDDIKDLFPTT